MVREKKSATNGHENRIEAIEETVDTLRNDLQAALTRLKNMQNAINNVALEKGEIDGKFVKVWEAIGSIRGSVGAVARHGGGEKPIMPPLPPGVELTPDEQKLFEQWRWTTKQIQDYANQKAFMQTVTKHIPAGSTPAPSKEQAPQKKRNDSS